MSDLGPWGTFAWKPISAVLDAGCTVEVALSTCVGLPAGAQVVIRGGSAGAFLWYMVKARFLREELAQAQPGEVLLERISIKNFVVTAFDVATPPPTTLDGRPLLVDGDRVIALLEAGTPLRGVDPTGPAAAFGLSENDPGSLDDVYAGSQGIEPEDQIFVTTTEPGPGPEPREQPARPGSLAAGIPAEQDTLHWNTWFPQDAATQRSRTVFVGIPYLLRTRLGTSPETGSLTQVTTTLEKLSQSGEPVDVTFRVESKGAGVRLAGTQDAFGVAIESGPLRCEKGRGTPAFDVELVAEGAGAVTIGLLLIVRNAVVFSEPVQLCAIETPPAPGFNAAAATVSHARLEGTRAASARLLVRRQNEIYTMEAQVGAVVSSALSAADRGANIDSAIVQARNQLVELSMAYTPSGAGFGLSAAEDVLQQFRTIGRKLHRVLFGPRNGNPSDLRNMATALAACGRKRVEGSQAPRLQIDSELLPIPWGLLYDGDDTASVDPSGFWGCRFQIDHVVRVPLSAGISSSVTLDLVPRTMVRPVINEGLDRRQKTKFVDTQKSFFADKKASAPMTSLASLEGFLKSDDPVRLLYFFCHAVTADTGPFHNHLSREATTLEVDDATISVQAMEDIRDRSLVGSPLVFLNACSSAQGDRAFQSVFVEHFVKTWGARGVVGTNWKVDAIFADRFARLALEKLLVDGLTLGDAFHQTTVEAMEQGNPFGLIYAIYAPPEIVAIYPPENQP